MLSKRLRKPSSMLIRILARNVVRLRRSRGLSQEQLAEVAGLHRTYIGSVERGERNVTLSTLEVLANALAVPVTALLNNTDNDEKSEF